MFKPAKRQERLRVIIISFMFSPIVGGAEAQAEKQARQLQAMGCDVTVITLRHDRKWKAYEVTDRLPVRRIGGIFRMNGTLRIGKWGHPPIDLALFWTLWRMRKRFDVVHAMQISSLSAVATFVCQLTNKPSIISIQSAGPDHAQVERLKNGIELMADTLTPPDPNYLKVNDDDWVGGDVENLPRYMPGGKFVLDYVRSSQAFYQVLSTRCATYLKENGFKAEQIERISNGIDTEKFRPAAQRPDPAKPEREITCVARLEYPKGVDVLLHAWGRMMNAPDTWRAGLKPRLRLVGEGVFQPQMEWMVSELGIQDSVEFLGTRSDVAELLQQSWGFVMPSRWEGMPNALLEAMSCGLPCVATRVSGSEDVIVDGVNGLAVEPEEPAEMALALKRMIEDSELAEQMGNNARATIMRDYQMETVAERSHNLYQRLRTNTKKLGSLALEETGEM